MATIKLAFNSTIKSIVILNSNGSIPSGSVSLGTFDHDDDHDLLGPAVNHSIFKHVQKTLASAGIRNMTEVTIFDARTNAIAAPSYSVNPSIQTQERDDGYKRYIAHNGKASDTVVYSRRWLLNGVYQGNMNVFVPKTVGNLVLEVTAKGPGGNTVFTTTAISVSPWIPHSNPKITLGNLTIASYSFVRGVQRIENILGTSALSTFMAVNLPDGFTFDEATKQLTVNAATAGDKTFYIDEYNDNAAISPRRSTFNVHVEAQKPAAPTLSVTPGNGKNTLAWTDGSAGDSAITKHRLYKGSNVDNIAYAGEILTGSPYEDSPLTNNVAVLYQLSSVSAVGEGPRSDIKSGTPVGGGSKPENTSVPTMSYNSGTKTYTLTSLGTWSNTPTSYEVWAYYDNAPRALLGTANGVTHVHLDIEDGLPFTMVVKATNSAGSAWAKTVAITNGVFESNVLSADFNTADNTTFESLGFTFIGSDPNNDGVTQSTEKAKFKVTSNRGTIATHASAGTPVNYSPWTGAMAVKDVGINWGFIQGKIVGTNYSIFGWNIKDRACYVRGVYPAYSNMGIALSGFNDKDTALSFILDNGIGFKIPPRASETTLDGGEYRIEWYPNRTWKFFFKRVGDSEFLPYAMTNSANTNSVQTDIAYPLRNVAAGANGTKAGFLQNQYSAQTIDDVRIGSLAKNFQLTNIDIGYPAFGTSTVKMTGFYTGTPTNFEIGAVLTDTGRPLVEFGTATATLNSDGSLVLTRDIDNSLINAYSGQNITWNVKATVDGQTFIRSSASQVILAYAARTPMSLGVNTHFNYDETRLGPLEFIASCNYRLGDNNIIHSTGRPGTINALTWNGLTNGIRDGKPRNFAGLGSIRLFFPNRIGLNQTGLYRWRNYNYTGVARIYFSAGQITGKNSGDILNDGDTFTIANAITTNVYIILTGGESGSPAWMTDGLNLSIRKVSNDGLTNWATTDFIADYSIFKRIRPMTAIGTNDQFHPSSIPSGLGVPMQEERTLQQIAADSLATGSDLMFNVHHSRTSEQVISDLTTLNNLIGGQVRIGIDPSNEVWNDKFPQYYWFTRIGVRAGYGLNTVVNKSDAVAITVRDFKPFGHMSCYVTTEGGGRLYVKQCNSTIVPDPTGNTAITIGNFGLDDLYTAYVGLKIKEELGTDANGNKYYRVTNTSDGAITVNTGSNSEPIQMFITDFTDGFGGNADLVKRRTSSEALTTGEKVFLAAGYGNVQVWEAKTSIPANDTAYAIPLSNQTETTNWKCLSGNGTINTELARQSAYSDFIKMVFDARDTVFGNTAAARTRLYIHDFLFNSPLSSGRTNYFERLLVWNDNYKRVNRVGPSSYIAHASGQLDNSGNGMGAYSASYRATTYDVGDYAGYKTAFFQTATEVITNCVKNILAPWCHGLERFLRNNAPDYVWDSVGFSTYEGGLEPTFTGSWTYNSTLDQMFQEIRGDARYRALAKHMMDELYKYCPGDHTLFELPALKDYTGAKAFTCYTETVGTSAWNIFSKPHDRTNPYWLGLKDFVDEHPNN